MTKQIPSYRFIVFSDKEVKVLIQKSFENDTENTYSAKVIFLKGIINLPCLINISKFINLLKPGLMF